MKPEDYWGEIDDNLEELINTGFTRLPSIKDFNLDKISDSISKELGDKTYTELCPSHRNFIDELGVGKILTPKLFSLAKKYYGYKGDIEDQYHIARRVERGNKSEGFRAHFDAHLFTLVLPIKIPKVSNKSDTVGDLIFFPSARKVPRNEVSNIINKAYFKKYASKKGVEELSKKQVMQTENFQSYQPLIFRGITTLHTNKIVSLNCSSYRLTLLAHFFDPSPRYGISSLLRLIRSR
tara:strand:- start:7953 stop:8663 length:711 start_codon:yes stop_codon:yes gene_type:complete